MSLNKLPPSTVNRIKAQQIITGLVAVVKELVEYLFLIIIIVLFYHSLFILSFPALLLLIILMRDEEMHWMQEPHKYKLNLKEMD